MDISELDNQIADSVKEFEARELMRGRLDEADRERMLDRTLGPRTAPNPKESFLVGDPSAGVTPTSIWFSSRRIHFATILSVAVGSRDTGKGCTYWVDVNCTLHRSFRIRVGTIAETDNFLVALSQFMSVRIVPTVEEEIREQRRVEELDAAAEANADRRQRRMELLSIRQQQLLRELIQVECAPRIAFGVIY